MAIDGHDPVDLDHAGFDIAAHVLEERPHPLLRLRLLARLECEPESALDAADERRHQPSRDPSSACCSPIHCVASSLNRSPRCS